MRRFVLFSICILVLASGCDEDQTVTPPGPDSPGTLAGSVYQQFVPEQTIAGATVTWGDETATTDEEGQYQFAPTETGSDSLRVTHADYRAQARFVELSSENLRESFALLPIDDTPPAPPEEFVGNTHMGNSIMLNWSPPAGRDEIAGYILHKSPGTPESQIFDAEMSSWHDIHVTASRVYTYTLFSRDAVGNLSEPLQVTAQVNLLPTALSLTISTDSDFGRIPMSWLPSTDDDFAAYRIYRAPALADSTDLLVFTSTDPQSSSFVDTHVEPNQVYSYRLYTYDESNQSNAQGSRLAAAQLFISWHFGINNLLALPGGNRFISAHAQHSEVMLADGDGEIITEIVVDVSAAPNSWLLVDGGARAWGMSQYGRLMLFGTDPLVLERSGQIVINTNDLAYLGNGRMLISMFTSGSPFILDTATFTEIESLPDLDDMPGGALVAADSTNSMGYIATTSENLLLYRFDLSGDATIAETVALPGRAVALRVIDGLGLCVGFQQIGRLHRYDLDDLSTFDSIDLNDQAKTGSFSLDGSEWWQTRWFDTVVDGFSIDFGAGQSTSITSFDMISTPERIIRLEDGSRVVTSISDNGPLISICDPSLPPAPRGHE